MSQDRLGCYRRLGWPLQLGRRPALDVRLLPGGGRRSRVKALIVADQEAHAGRPLQIRGAIGARDAGHARGGVVTALAVGDSPGLVVRTAAGHLVVARGLTWVGGLLVGPRERTPRRLLIIKSTETVPGPGQGPCGVETRCRLTQLPGGGVVEVPRVPDHLLLALMSRPAVRVELAVLVAQPGGQLR